VSGSEYESFVHLYVHFYRYKEAWGGDGKTQIILTLSSFILRGKALQCRYISASKLEMLIRID